MPPLRTENWNWLQAWGNGQKAEMYANHFDIFLQGAKNPKID